MRQEDAPILRFFLYDEAPSDVEADFMNVEAIPLRSGAHNWIIRPHTHPYHVQILLVVRGGGSIRLDERTWDIPPPCLIIVPAGVVHEISFAPTTDGVVITVADAYTRAATAGEDKRLTAALTRGQVLPVGTGSDLEAAFQGILREFVWSGPGRRAAIKGYYLCILVSLLRLENAAPDNTAGGLPRRDQDIVSRFREEVERRFRTEKRLEHYQAVVGVSASRLHDACMAVMGSSPARILHTRIMVEAKRLLLYSGLPVSEIGHRLGFEDPAYFSRFFTQRAGQSPRAYRACEGAALAGPAKTGVVT